MNDALNEANGPEVDTGNGGNATGASALLSQLWNSAIDYGIHKLDGLSGATDGKSNAGGATQSQGGGAAAATGKAPAGTITQQQLITYGVIALVGVVGVVVLVKTLKD